MRLIKSMVKLFCKVVGVKGSAFAIDINASETVGDLKNAVKANNVKYLTKP